MDPDAAPLPESAEAFVFRLTEIYDEHGTTPVLGVDKLIALVDARDVEREAAALERAAGLCDSLADAARMEARGEYGQGREHAYEHVADWLRAEIERLQGAAARGARGAEHG